MIIKISSASIRSVLKNLFNYFSLKIANILGSGFNHHHGSTTTTSENGHLVFDDHRLSPVYNPTIYVGMNIGEFLHHNGLGIMEVNGDGHCILNAVLSCLHNQNEPLSIERLKQFLVRFAYDHKQKYSQFMIGTQPMQFYQVKYKMIIHHK